ncbi:hypothetical protein [Lentilactobacillus sp. Marseille-Q4993]|uniref:hypothetical protein n=1 Tax=Lentilactobacillus sp. Marseille-Q4993 TaxID=3039492 RepID=UPI0024BC8A44|nr:hypothetical protein [Lentilactobacillus sp. Marseille-Q4993]
MKRIIKFVAKYMLYIIGAAIALFLVTWFTGDLNTSVLNIDVNLRSIYLVINCLMLPLFRMMVPSWYASDPKQFESYKDRAMNLHYEDMNQNHKDRIWTANGTRINPWEYTQDTTQTYQHASDFAYTFCRNLLINILFIWLSPLFWIIVFFLHRNRS